MESWESRLKGLLSKDSASVTRCRHVSNNKLQSFLLVPDLHEVCAQGSYCNSERSRILETVLLFHIIAVQLKLQYIAKPKHFTSSSGIHSFPSDKKKAMPCSKPIPMFKLRYSFAPPQFSYITDWHPLGSNIS